MILVRVQELLILLTWQKVLLGRHLSNSLKVHLLLIQRGVESDQWGWLLIFGLSLLQLRARSQKNLEPNLFQRNIWRWSYTVSMQWCMGWPQLVPASSFEPASQSSRIQARFLLKIKITFATKPSTNHQTSPDSNSQLHMYTLIQSFIGCGSLSRLGPQWLLDNSTTQRAFYVSMFFKMVMQTFNWMKCHIFFLEHWMRIPLQALPKIEEQRMSRLSESSSWFPRSWSVQSSNGRGIRNSMSNCRCVILFC